VREGRTKVDLAAWLEVPATPKRDFVQRKQYNYPLPRVGKRNPGIKTRERRDPFTKNRERKRKKG